MRSFRTWDGLRIAYRGWGTESEMPPVVLIHGFAADAISNWQATGVVDALVDSGRRVLAPDARGHGSSEKPHDPARYGEPKMARDLSSLLDTLGLARVDLVGYSMGAIVALILASLDERVRRLVVGGVGAGVVECGGVDRRAVPAGSIIDALRVDDPSTLSEPGAKVFRALADSLDADREALLAQARAVHRGGVALERISAPTLVLAGDHDPLAVRPELLSGAIGGATLRILRGDHISALVDPTFRESIVEFLA